MNISVLQPVPDQESLERCEDIIADEESFEELQRILAKLSMGSDTSAPQTQVKAQFVVWLIHNNLGRVGRAILYHPRRRYELFANLDRSLAGGKEYPLIFLSNKIKDVSRDIETTVARNVAVYNMLEYNVRTTLMRMTETVSKLDSLPWIGREIIDNSIELMLSIEQFLKDGARRSDKRLGIKTGHETQWKKTYAAYEWRQYNVRLFERYILETAQWAHDKEFTSLEEFSGIATIWLSRMVVIPIDL